MNAIIVDGYTMKDMGQTSPIRAWLKYKDISITLDTSGIYAIKLCDEVVYVGQSGNLFARLLEHCTALFSDKPSGELKYTLLREHYKDLSWTVLSYESTETLIETENYYIDRYKPIFNIQTPKGEQYFWGTSNDIEDFCYGLLTIDDLKSLVKENKKTKKEVNFLTIVEYLDNTVEMPQKLRDGLEAHILHSNAVNDIIKALTFKEQESERMGIPCRLVIELKDDRLIATSYDINGKFTGRRVMRKRRIWDWQLRKMHKTYQND